MPETRTRHQEPSDREKKTYRYLRVAMVLMAVGLGVSVLYERVKAPEDCWQISISAYYYTPVQGFFVAAMVTIGVCLIALQATTRREDVALNLAGACAPFVAFVPTPAVNVCGYNLTDEGARNLSVGNNVFALLVIAGLTLVVAAVLPRLPRTRFATAPSRADRVGYAVATALYVGTAYAFFVQRTFFLRWGHLAAAVLMFVLIAAVVRFNGQDARSRRLRSAYRAVFAGMVAAAVLNGAAGLAGWDHWALCLEACLIGLFTVFWIVQTVELWNAGVRPPDGTPATPQPASALPRSGEPEAPAPAR
jgi:hypothetical protein